jgi:Ca-activated chloride channel family protein
MELDEIKYYTYFYTAGSGGIIPFQFYWKRKKQRIWGFRIGKKLSPERSVLNLFLNWFDSFGFDGIDWIGKSKIGTKMETVKREGIDIVFSMDVSKVCLPKMLRKSIRKKKQIVSQIM